MRKNHFNILAVLALLIIGCGEKKNATVKNDVSINNAPTENVAIETTSQEKQSQIVVSKTDPPKYANKAAVIAHLIERYNHYLEVPLSKEQIDQINALAKSSRVTTFKNQHSCSMFTRRMVQKIKSKVLTPEQLVLLEERRAKEKNNVKR